MGQQHQQQCRGYREEPEDPRQPQHTPPDYPENNHYDASQQQQPQQVLLPTIAWRGVALVFLGPALGGFLYGYDIGATSFVMMMLLFSSSSTTNLEETSNSGFGARKAPEQRIEWWSNDSTTDGIDFHTSTVQQGFMVAAVALGAMVGSYIACFHMETIGRRMELRIASILYMIGTACNIASGTIFASVSSTTPIILFGSGLSCLIFGRFLFGIGVGFVMHGAPTYLAEMTPTPIRGAVVSAKETVIVFGILMGYWAGDIIVNNSSNNNNSNRWVYLYVVSALLSIPMLILTFCIPRSLRWLLMQQQQHHGCGYRDEAIASIKFVYRCNNHKDEIAIMNEFCHIEASILKAAATSSSSSSSSSSRGVDKGGFKTQQVAQLPTYSSTLSTGAKVSDNNTTEVTCTSLIEVVDGGCGTSTSTGSSSLWQKMVSPTLWPATRAAMGLIVLQQFSGQPSVLSFSAVIFHAAGWNGRASVVTALVMLCVSTTTVLTVDRYGRKRLLYLCCAVLAVSAATLSWQFWNWNTVDDGPTLSTYRRIVVLIAMLTFIGGYQIGFGPITWLIVSEVFPSDVRGAATAVGVELNYLLNFVVQFLVPIAKDRIGWGPTFGMYATILLFALSFVHLYVPETAGLSLEDIEDQLSQQQQQHPSPVEDITIENGVSECTPLMDYSESSRRSRRRGSNLTPIREE